MPNDHYMVVAKLVLCAAHDDVPRSEEIRTAIKDIWDIRAAKLRSSMDEFLRGDGVYANLNNLTQLEIHSVRPLVTHSLDLIDRLQRVNILFLCLLSKFYKIYFSANTGGLIAGWCF